MAGAFLLRSFGFKLDGMEPGAVVLSDRANEAGPRLIRVLGVVLDSLGIRLAPQRVGAAEAQESKPLLSFLETQRSLEPRFDGIRAGLGCPLLRLPRLRRWRPRS